MRSHTTVEASTATAGCPGPVRIRAHHAAVNRLGAWTTARHFDVVASKSSVVPDLLLAQLEPGEVEISLDVDHTMVKLLVPDGTVIDHDDLRRVGRGRVKDWTGVAAAGGRTVRLVGEMRHSEVRIHRGGVASLSLLLGGQRKAVRQAQALGRLGGDGASKR